MILLAIFLLISLRKLTTILSVQDPVPIKDQPHDLVNISKMIEQKRLLDTLQNASVSTFTKLKLLDKGFRISAPNINAGDLLQEW